MHEAQVERMTTRGRWVRVLVPVVASVGLLVLERDDFLKVELLMEFACVL
jgi:hypothetical protein